MQTAEPTTLFASSSARVPLDTFRLGLFSPLIVVGRASSCAYPYDNFPLGLFSPSSYRQSAEKLTRAVDYEDGEKRAQRESVQGGHARGEATGRGCRPRTKRRRKKAKRASVQGVRARGCAVPAMYDTIRARMGPIGNCSKCTSKRKREGGGYRPLSTLVVLNDHE